MKIVNKCECRGSSRVPLRNRLNAGQPSVRAPSSRGRVATDLRQGSHTCFVLDAVAHPPVVHPSYGTCTVDPDAWIGQAERHRGVDASFYFFGCVFRGATCGPYYVRGSASPPGFAIVPWFVRAMLFVTPPVLFAATPNVHTTTSFVLAAVACCLFSCVTAHLGIPWKSEPHEAVALCSAHVVRYAEGKGGWLPTACRL